MKVNLGKREKKRNSPVHSNTAVKTQNLDFIYKSCHWQLFFFYHCFALAVSTPPPSLFLSPPWSVSSSPQIHQIQTFEIKPLLRRNSDLKSPKSNRRAWLSSDPARFGDGFGLRRAMKRDLDFALGAESEVAGSVTRSRKSAIQFRRRSSSLEVVDAEVSRKRAKVTKINGYIVYTRTKKKSRIDACDEFLETLQSWRLKNLGKRRNAVVDSVIEDRPGGGEVVNVVRGDGNQLVDNVVDDSMTVTATIRESRVAGNSIDELSLVEVVIKESRVFNENAIEGRVVVEPIDDSFLVQNVIVESHSVADGEKLMTGYDSQMILHEGELMHEAIQSLTGLEVVYKESFAGDLQLVENEEISNMNEAEAAEGNGLGTPRKNLELKMSKKISLNKCPMTVKELFETGILDGVPVIYMGTISSKTAGLRGIIKDGGILCSCSACKGCRVVPPSQFEIHACKQYKRAAQYICFENGKSLLELLRAIRRRPLHMLESTIHSLVTALPEEKFFSCRRCKGTFPIVDVGQIGPLCNACVELKKKSQCSPNCSIRRARSLDLVLASQSPGSTPLGFSAQNNCFRSPEPVSTHHSSPSTSVEVTPQSKSQRITRKSEFNATSKSPICEPMSLTLQNKTTTRIMGKSTEPVSLAMSLKGASAHISAKKKAHLKLIKKSKKSALLSKSCKSASPHSYSLNSSHLKMISKDQRLHKLVFEEGGLPDGSEVAYFARGKRLLVGYKKGSGIFCSCCNSEVSPSTFEAHAGWSSRRKPYAYIYTSNGVSLHELAISLSKGRRHSSKDNDDACIICADGGNLLLCDGCPRAFHRECASLSTIPRGRWYCQYCQNLFVKEKFDAYNANALAAGRVVGVDALDQISKRCIRIVKDIEAELSGCVLCRCCDFSKSGFGPRTIILCDQCEKEYHIGCLRSFKMADLKELPKGKWFCCMDCNRIHTILQRLLIRGAEKIPDSLLGVIKKKCEAKGLDTTGDIDVRWRLLNGKIASPETRLLLSQAVAIFHECFNPIVDVATGRDLIPCMVYGRNLKGQEYGGMYCAVLTVNSLVVSAGILRVFGKEIAELPLVATSIPNRGKGYFQLLFSCIEKLLAYLKVKTLVLPAAEEAESIWTDKFSFRSLHPDQYINYRRSCCQMVRFKGTSMLQKEVPLCRIANSSPEPTEPDTKTDLTKPGNEGE